MRVHSASASCGHQHCLPHKTASACHHRSFYSQMPALAPKLDQHRLLCHGIEARPAAFTDASHVRYYETTAGSRKGKVVKRIKEQRNRLRELAAQLPAEPDAAVLQMVVTEMAELSERLTDVSKMAADSSSSSSSSDSNSSCDEAVGATRGAPQLTALAQLASRLASEGDAVCSPVDISHRPSPAAAVVSRAHAISPAAAEPELAAVLRLPGVASDGASHHSEQQMADSPAQQADRGPDAGPRSNIVAMMPPPAARVAVCQGKSCAKRGAVELLQQATSATSGVPGVQVAPCKCLGKCKQGPAVRVRTGKEKPVMLTHAADDGGRQLAQLLQQAAAQASKQEPQLVSF